MTIEDSENMGLADFDCRVHAGVLLDGSGDAMLKRNFCGQAVMPTFDLSAQNLEELHTDCWPCNCQNVQLQCLAGLRASKR